MLTESGDGFKEVGEGLKKVQAWPDLGPSQKYTQGKLNQEFKASLTEFQTLQRQALEKQRASASAARTALDQEGAEGLEHLEGVSGGIRNAALAATDYAWDIKALVGPGLVVELEFHRQGEAGAEGL